MAASPQLSGGAVAGIVIGTLTVIVVLVIAACLACPCYLWGRPSRTPSSRTRSNRSCCSWPRKLFSPSLRPRRTKPRTEDPDPATVEVTPTAGDDADAASLVDHTALEAALREDINTTEHHHDVAEHEDGTSKTQEIPLQSQDVDSGLQEAVSPPQEGASITQTPPPSSVDSSGLVAERPETIIATKHESLDAGKPDNEFSKPQDISLASHVDGKAVTDPIRSNGSDATFVEPGSPVINTTSKRLSTKEILGLDDRSFLNRLPYLEDKTQAPLIVPR